MRTVYRTIRFAAFAAAAFVTACDSSTEPMPTAASVVGTYLAEGTTGTFRATIVGGGETMDWLAAGGRFELTLQADGTARGEMILPGVEEDGGDFEVDLTGTWTLNGRTLRLQHDADSFLRDTEFTVGRDGHIRADRTFSGVRVQILLVRL